MATFLDLATDALISIGEVAQGEDISAEDLQYCLTRGNTLLDMWSTMRLMLPTVDKTTVNLLPSVIDYTIGTAAGATFNLPRPVLIQTATAIVAGTSIRIPLSILTSKQWAARRQDLVGDVPEEVYLDGAFPNAGLHFRPAPSGGMPVELYVWNELQQFVDGSTILSFPPGYYNCIMWGLAEVILPGYNRPPDPLVIKNAADGRAAVMQMNAQLLGGSFGEANTLEAPNIGKIPQAQTQQGPPQQ